MVDRLRLWLRTVLMRRRLDREMREEMAAHLAQSTARLMARGLSAAEARRAALREFGNVGLLQEQARDARGARWIESIAADVRFAVRHFRRTPLTTATIIVVLVVGIGANTGLVAYIHSVMTLPAPGIPRDDALVRIRGIARDARGWTRMRQLSYPEVREYAALDAFSDVAAWAGSGVLLQAGEADQGPVAASAHYVTGNYFPLLGVRPVLGRGLPATSDDVTANPVTVISHRLWDAHFGRSPDVVGRVLRLNDASVSVVGVAPPLFGGVDAHQGDMAVWLPLSARPLVERGSSAALASYDSTMLSAVSRLRPGITRADAEPAVETIAGRTGMHAANPEGFTQGYLPTADVAPLLARNLRPGNDRADALEAATFGVITLLILLVTCTNVSALLVGMAVARRREIAVRLSLGASRTRLIRQLLTECVLLAGAAGAVGIAVIWFAISRARVYLPEIQLALDWPAVLFTLACALTVGVLFGLSPALHATRLAVADVLKNSAAAVAASRSRLQPGLVVAQVALTQPLLVALATLLVLLVGEMHGRAPSPLHNRILAVSFDSYSGNATADERRATMMRLEERIAGMLGVQGVVQQTEGYYVNSAYAVHPDDRGPTWSGPERFALRSEPAPAGFFELMDMPFVRGRDFTAEERNQSATSIVIGSELARELWGGTVDPIGRRFVDMSGGAPDSVPLVVVGVVDQSQAGRAYISADIPVYIPWMVWGTEFLVRTRGPADALLPAIRAVARAEAPGMPIRSAETLAEIAAAEQKLLMRANAAVAAGGLVALLLAAIGLYAVIAFAVGQRTREIGVRTALGAQRSQVIGMFLGSGLRLALLGLLIGLPIALVALRFISTQAGIPQANTALVGAATALVVIAVGAVATWLPARRAASIDPLVALRSD
ncbi:MAG: ABC transporter permease [Gemmatimonadota bacterium]